MLGRPCAGVPADQPRPPAQTGRGPSRHCVGSTSSLETGTWFSPVPALAGRLRDYVAVLTRDVWNLEQRVTAGHLGDAEQFLDEMFRARHGLLTEQTMAALSREVYAISSILGMNVIVNENTQPFALAIALAVMATISGILLVWAKRKGGGNTTYRPGPGVIGPVRASAGA